MNHWAYQCPDLTTEQHAGLKAVYDKGEQKHGSVHAQVGVVVEGCVSVIVKGDIKAFQVTGKKSINIKRVYLDI